MQFYCTYVKRRTSFSRIIVFVVESAALLAVGWKEKEFSVLLSSRIQQEVVWKKYLHFFAERILFCFVDDFPLS